MRHLKKGWKLKRTASHRKALLRNLAMSLLEHKKIVTTVAKAKALRPFVEKIITRAKRAVIREKNGQLPEGMKYDIHSRRLVASLIPNKAIVQELFDTIAPTVLDRPGGYTRIVKLGFRRGDAAELAAIELVDWGAPQDGNVSLKQSKKKAAKKTAKAKAPAESKKKAAKAPEPVAEQAPEPVAEKTEAAMPSNEVKEEKPQAEVSSSSEESALAEEAQTAEDVTSASAESDANSEKPSQDEIKSENEEK